MAAVAVILCAPVARGHTILISRGSIEMCSDRVVAVIEVGAEDFTHDPRLRASILEGYSIADVRAVVERHGARLLDGLTIRDAVGERLPGRLVETRCDLPADGHVAFEDLRGRRVTYRIEHAVAAVPAYLTFQWRPGPGSDAAAVSQLVLSIRVAGGGEQLIPLSNRGNAETVAVAAPLDKDREKARAGDGRHGDCGRAGQPAVMIGPTADRAFAADRFKGIQGIVRREANDVCIEVYLPFAVLEKFAPVRRIDPDFLAPAEIDAARAALAELLIGRVQVRVCEHVVPGRVEKAAILSPYERFIGDAPIQPRRLGVWSARAAVSLRFAAGAAASQSGQPWPGEVTLRWDLFNPAVLNATVWEVPARGEAIEHRLLPGAADVILRRSAE